MSLTSTVAFVSSAPRWVLDHCRDFVTEAFAGGELSPEDEMGVVGMVVGALSVFSALDDRMRQQGSSVLELLPPPEEAQ